MEVEELSLADLKPHPRNYREHPEDQIAHIVESINTNGFYRNIVVAKDGTILAGHGVVEAVQSMGRSTIPGIRVDIDPDDPAAIKILTGDNYIQHLGEVDDRILSELLMELQDDKDTGGLLGTGFDEAMLANLVYTTRPKEEVDEMDHAAEWAEAGMPEYAVTMVPCKLVIAFPSFEERARYVEENPIEIRNRRLQTWSTWWPPKPIDDLSSIRYE